MEKDWTGNGSFCKSTNFRKKDSEVSLDDYYATHPDSVRALLRNFTLNKNAKIWEPACGGGNISKVLIEHGFKVYSTDLRDRGYGDGQHNFLMSYSLPQPDIDVILTNPPYKYSIEFVEKSLQLLPLNGLCIMFLKLTFLEGKARYKLFKNNPPLKVLVFSSRQGCSAKGEYEFINGGAAAYAWYIWMKGYTQKTTLDWIEPF